MSKSLFFVIVLVLLATFGLQVALAQDCKGYTVYPDPGAGPRCYYLAVGVYWVSDGLIATTVDITNTTQSEVQYDLIPRSQVGYKDYQPVQLWSRIGTGTPAAGAVFTTALPGMAKTVTFMGTAVWDGADFQPTHDPITMVGEMYIRVVGTPEALDQQKDSAIVITTAYRPEVVTVALPWSWFAPVVRRTSLRSGASGNITETPNGNQVTVKDRHNMFLLVNTGEPQQVRITLLDYKGNVLGVPFVTRQLATDELYDATTIQSLFGSMFLGSTGDVSVRILFEGLGGFPIFVQNLELLGGPYAVSTTPTWAVGN